MPPLSLSSTLALSDGLALPRLGLGVYLSRGSEGKRAILHALKTGYRHIDTAQLYKNEKECGEALRESGLKREEVWITSKIWDSNHGYEPCKRSLDESLNQAGLDFFDLMLLHSPNPGKEKRLEAWRALIEAKKAGKVKSIGVSNYGVHHIQELLQKFPDDPPSVNQIELSPFFQRSAIVEECKRHNIAVEAYSPLGKGAFTDLPELHQISSKHNKLPAHVLIRWSLQKGYVVLPKSITPARIEANADVFDFELSEAEMSALDKMETGSGITWDPTQAP